MRFVVSTVVAVTVLLGAVSAQAQDQRLPDFHVRTAAGAEVASNTMTSQDKWLLIYVSPACRSCETLMRALPKWQSPDLLARTVLVVGGPLQAAAEWIGKAVPPELSTLAWYGDPQREAWTALELTGAPVLIGIQSGQIEWRVIGVLNSPDALESVVRSWVEPRP